VRTCQKIARGVGSVTFAGQLGREEVRARINAASGFVLPSRRETFGLVFIEALFAGTPIVYPKGQAVSGYFDGLPFAIPVRADDPRAIAASMKRLIDEETALKAALEQWQNSPAADRFKRAAIGEAFAAGLDRALAARETATT
jgi:glycosyltransferase involved in cell wall biosynthesis